MFINLEAVMIFSKLGLYDVICNVRQTAGFGKDEKKIEFYIKEKIMPGTNHVNCNVQK